MSTVATTERVRGHQVRESARDETRTGLLAAVERKVGLTPAGLAVVAVAGGGVGVGRQLQNRGMFLAAYGLLFIVVASWLLGRRRLKVTAHRSDLPSRVRSGYPVSVDVEVTADQRVPTVVLHDQLHHSLGPAVRVPVAGLAAGAELAYSYLFTPGRRGVYSVGPLVADWTDPFGLTRRRQVISAAERVIVHPRLEPLVDRILSRAWEDPPIRPPQLKPWPTGFEFYGLREYVPGDDPRRIVWRAVAQYDEYVVRESEQGITDRINIVLDTDRSEHSPGEFSETFETAVSVVASLARQHLNDGFSVTIETGGETFASRLSGRTQLIPLLDQLAPLSRDGASMTSALDRLLARGARGAHNVVVTAVLSAAAAQRLRILIETGASILVVLCLWEDTDPATIHRAGLLGCNVVEVHPHAPLGAGFARVAAGGRAR